MEKPSKKAEYPQILEQIKKLEHDIRNFEGAMTDDDFFEKDTDITLCMTRLLKTECTKDELQKVFSKLKELTTELNLKHEKSLNVKLLEDMDKMSDISANPAISDLEVKLKELENFDTKGIDALETLKMGAIENCKRLIKVCGIPINKGDDICQADCAPQQQTATEVGSEAEIVEYVEEGAEAVDKEKQAINEDIVQQSDDAIDAASTNQAQNVVDKPDYIESQEWKMLNDIAERYINLLENLSTEDIANSFNEALSDLMLVDKIPANKIAELRRRKKEVSNIVNKYTDAMEIKLKEEIGDDISMIINRIKNGITTDCSKAEFHYNLLKLNSLIRNNIKEKIEINGITVQLYKCLFNSIQNQNNAELKDMLKPLQKLIRVLVNHKYDDSIADVEKQYIANKS